MGTLSRFVTEARRRRVFRTGGLYIVGAWALLQVADLALESLGLPGELLRYFWIAAFVGFPLALVFGWYYDITAEGIRRTLPADGVPDENLQMRVPDYVIIGALAVIVAIVSAGLFDRARQSDELVGPYDPMGVAVLPLEDLSGVEGQEYFSAGIHDALITNLSKIKGLHVVSRRSAIRLDRALPTQVIGKTLGVRNIIEGSVTREGNRVRVIVQLIDAANDAHLWADNFEREFDSMLALQNDIAKSVASALDVQLSTDDEARLAGEERVDPQTYDDYLRGMYLLNQPDNRVRRRGISILERVVAEGRADARVYAALAYGYAALGHSPFPEDMYPSSRRAAERAMELDDSIAEVHLALGMHNLYYEWDFVAAERSLLRAIELNPGLLGAHYHYAWLMELLQRSNLSLPAGDITVDIDPLSAKLRGDLAWQYTNARQYERALVIASEALEIDPRHDRAMAAKAMTLAYLGLFDAAISTAAEIPERSGNRFIYPALLAAGGRSEEAREALATIEHIPRNVIILALGYGALGDVDDAFHWLGVAKDVKHPWYPWFITGFPFMDAVSNDPRMDELAAELGLTEALQRGRRKSSSGPPAT